MQTCVPIQLKERTFKKKKLATSLLNKQTKITNRIIQYSYPPSIPGRHQHSCRPDPQKMATGQWVEFFFPKWSQAMLEMCDLASMK